MRLCWQYGFCCHKRKRTWYSRADEIAWISVHLNSFLTAGGPPEQASLRCSFGGTCVHECILWNLEQGRGNTCALVRKHPLHKSIGVTVKSLEAGGPDS